jgi:hypothetical protein
MKNRLREKEILSLPHLIKEIKLLWACDLSRDYLKNLSDSMPRRIQEMLKAKGDASKH